MFWFKQDYLLFRLYVWYEFFLRRLAWTNRYVILEKSILQLGWTVIVQGGFLFTTVLKWRPLSQSKELSTNPRLERGCCNTVRSLIPQTRHWSNCIVNKQKTNEKLNYNIFLKCSHQTFVSDQNITKLPYPFDLLSYLN